MVDRITLDIIYDLCYNESKPNDKEVDKMIIYILVKSIDILSADIHNLPFRKIALDFIRGDFFV